MEYHSRKYSLDESFFDEWTSSMAYVLGFWFADGYMRHDKSYRIVFTSKDEEILIKIRTALGSTNPVRARIKEDAHVLAFHSRHLFEKLKELGGTPRKSLTVEFPDIPEKYLADFIRGYFDGDGSVFFVEYIRTKDNRRTRELRSNFTSGSRNFLEKLMVILQDKLQLPIKKLGVFNNGRSLKLGYGMRDTDILLRYMYYDNFSIGMDRKAVFVSRIPKYQLHGYSSANYHNRKTEVVSSLGNK